MKRKILILTALFFTVVEMCFAEGRTKDWEGRFKFAKNPEEFVIDYFPTKYMKEIKNKEIEDMPTTKSYKISKGGSSGELRYTLFKDYNITTRERGLQFAMTCLDRISGIKPYPLDNMYYLANDSLKENFNGDYGYMTMFEGNNSEYSKGYDVVWAEFIFKFNQGLVMRCFLTNDPEFFGTTEDGSYYEKNARVVNYETFKFKE